MVFSEHCAEGLDDETKLVDHNLGTHTPTIGSASAPKVADEDVESDTGGGACSGADVATSIKTSSPTGLRLPSEASLELARAATRPQTRAAKDRRGGSLGAPIDVTAPGNSSKGGG